MRHITELVWEAAGCPEPPSQRLYSAEAAVCVMCGRTVGSTAPATRVIGNNFTDQYLFHRSDSTRICPACAWCCAGKPPASLRMWSVVAAPGLLLPPSHSRAWIQEPDLCLTNRADPAPIADLLLAPPETEWACTVAVSAQKHVVPYGRVNHGGRGSWTVRMETTDVTADADQWRHVLGHTAALRQDGHSADAVRNGCPDLQAVRTGADLERWRLHADALACYRRAPLLELALWCVTKTTLARYAALAALPEGVHV